MDNLSPANTIAGKVVVGTEATMPANPGDVNCGFLTSIWGGAFGGGEVWDVGTPSDPGSAANKAYADTKWTMWTGTQAAYDAIGTKDPKTLYAIVG